MLYTSNMIEKGIVTSHVTTLLATGDSITYISLINPQWRRMFASKSSFSRLSVAIIRFESGDCSYILTRLLHLGAGCLLALLTILDT